MAIPLGTETKRQVYLVAALFGVVALISAWEIYGAFGSSSTPARLAAVHNPAQTIPAAGSSRKSGIEGLEPKLQIGHMARIENVEYATTGRNIFSGESVPVQIEAPVAPARPITTLVSSGPPERPRPPAIDLKYLGYVQGRDKTYDALVIRGDDSSLARTGEVVFHYFKVGAIQPASVQVTDLRFNNTQTIAVTEK
jgi:hypothetical protein